MTSKNIAYERCPGAEVQGGSGENRWRWKRDGLVATKSYKVGSSVCFCTCSPYGKTISGSTLILD